MMPHTPSYTLVGNHLLPSWPTTWFKWLLVMVSVGLIMGALAYGYRDDRLWEYLSPMAFASVYLLQWANRLSQRPKSSDPDLPRRVDLYRRLKDHPWAPTASEMMAKWLYVQEDRKILGNPLTWNRKQRVLYGTDGQLGITLYEHNGVVGKVKLELQATFVEP